MLSFILKGQCKMFTPCIYPRIRSNPDCLNLDCFIFSHTVAKRSEKSRAGGWIWSKKIKISFDRPLRAFHNSHRSASASYLILCRASKAIALFPPLQGILLPPVGQNQPHLISVADPWHFGVDPDPRIHASDQWIRILLFSSLTFKMPAKN